MESIGKCGNVNAYGDEGVEQIREALGSIGRGKEDAGRAAQEAAAAGA